MRKSLKRRQNWRYEHQSNNVLHQIWFKFIQAGEDLVLDPDWTDAKKFESSNAVRAILLRKHGSAGVARVGSNPTRYTLTSKLTGIVLVAAKPGENIVLLGYPSVRYFRRRNF
jgi:hypothetical protein